MPLKSTRRRSIHRLAASALVTAMFFSLSGCNIGAPVSRGPSPATQPLKIWVMQDDLSPETISAINREFTRQTGRTTQIQTQPWDGIDTKLTTTLATADPPDVIDVGNTKVLDYAMSGSLWDLTSSAGDFDDSKTWLPGLAEPATTNGRLYGVPAFGATRTLICNMKIWRASGIQTPPRTYDELRRDLRRIAEDHAGEPDFSALYIPGQNWFSGIQFVWDSGADLAKRTHASWRGSASSPASVRALRDWGRFQNSFSASSSRSSAPNNPDQAQLLAQGRAATILWNSGAVTKALSINPDLSRSDLVTVPMPSAHRAGTAKDGADPAMPSVVAGSDWVVPARSRNQELALRWIRIAVSARIQKKWIVGHDGWLPNNTTLLEQELRSGNLDPAQRGFFEAALSSRSTPTAPGWSTLESDGSLRELFSSVARRPDSAAEAARRFDSHATDVFARARGGH